jgi:signal peptidase II
MQNRWLSGAVSCFDGSVRRTDVAVSTNHASKTEQRLFAPDAARWLGLAAVVALTVVVLDAITKWLIEREIGPGAGRAHIQLMGSFVELRYTLNSGVAFGFLSGSSTLAGILVAMVFVPLLAVLVIMAARGPLWAIAGGLVLGGAAGNLIDRIGDQTVRDFVSVGRFPSFNVADASITVGALILIGLSLFEHRSETDGEASKR